MSAHMCMYCRADWASVWDFVDEVDSDEDYDVDYVQDKRTYGERCTKCGEMNGKMPKVVTLVKASNE